MCRERSHEVYACTHFQFSLQGLDGGQVRQPAALTRRNTNHQSSSCVAAALQRRPLPSCPCCLSGSWPRIIGIFLRLRQSSSGLRVRISDVGHSPTQHFGLTVPQNSKTHCSFKTHSLCNFSFHFLPYMIFFIVYIPFFFNTIQG